MINFLKNKKAHIFASCVFVVSFGLVVFVVFSHDYEPKLISANTHRVAHNVQIEQKTDVKIEDEDIEYVYNSEVNEGGVIDEAGEINEEIYSPFHFIAIGDSEREKSSYGLDENIIGIFDTVKSLHPDFILFTGDIIMVGADSRGADASVRHVKNIFDTHLSDIPYYITLGYHDVECGTRCVDLWYKYFFDTVYEKNEEKTAYHSFDYENTHFILLSTDYPEKRTIDENQMTWLEANLEKTEKENIIVAMHVPPVTFFKESAKDCHDFACQPQLQEKLKNIFERNDVDLVISGHENTFDHQVINGIDYIISGSSSKGKAKYKNAQSGQIFSDIIVNNKMITVQGISLEDGVIREIRVK